LIFADIGTQEVMLSLHAELLSLTWVHRDQWMWRSWWRSECRVGCHVASDPHRMAAEFCMTTTDRQWFP